MTITEWLDEGGSFASGLHLLRATGATIPAALERAAGASFVDPAAKDLLRSRLQALRPAQEEAPANKPAHKPVKQRYTAPTGDSPTPVEVLTLKERGKTLLKQQARLHALLCAAETDAERYEIAREMMEDVIPMIDSVYNSVRDWEKTGMAPPDDHANIIRSTVEKMQRLESLRTRSARVKTWLDGKRVLSPQERQRYEQEVAVKELEMAEIRAELGME